MRITDINAKRKTKNAKLQFKTQNFKFWVVVFTFTFLFLPLLTGCGQKNEFKQAQDYIKKSKEYYQYAINLYKDLIAKGKDSDRLHFELGELYYNHGEWKQAIEEFKKTNILAAKKFLAISYYRLGNFTDALEIFNREKSLDDEGRYYYGLTAERLNLFDQALKTYKEIKGAEFKSKAALRLEEIERQTGIINIKDADPQAAKILLAAPDAKLYPQAGALILFCDEKIEVTPQIPRFLPSII